MALVFILMASVMNAVMDRLENESFFSSVFKDWDQKFWYKRESWKYAKVIFNYRVDGWHLSKSAMIVFIALAIVSYEKLFNPIVDFVLIGIVWNVTFEFMYATALKSTDNNA